ncbi:ubiquitin carboxyl-terminal hydrolase MINDY-2 isoform X1 [Hydra vulgaris]|uniref:ubiquitin carboxyl-terminal hydrolase MINDY-2 isoform X1 n=1 Tax=Hydra vulgaris TaxID=6087 RepID=UPI001F5EEB6B|nr:ubiquitin carboxyl-terminal hydrolase MINDY-2 [Hydra vulgaris]
MSLCECINTEENQNILKSSKVVVMETCKSESDEDLIDCHSKERNNVLCNKHEIKCTNSEEDNKEETIPNDNINKIEETKDCHLKSSDEILEKIFIVNDNVNEVSIDKSVDENFEYCSEPKPSCNKEERNLFIENNPTIVKQNDTYHLKWFDWKGEQTPVVTQNENGPCPLIAIGNVLVLARKITIPKMQQFITAKQLIEHIGDCILAEFPKFNESEEVQLNHAQNLEDAIDILHKLQNGIDVNVKFGGVTDFEFTRECIVFDLLRIGLYHGWLVEPQDEVTLKAVNGFSYNQLIDKIISKSDDSESLAESIAIEDFLSRTASQLTYHGLCELNLTIKEEELCVLFRNNHFSTLYKHKGELFILVTDQGFLTEPAVIWETFSNIEGDGQFVNSEFKSVVFESDKQTSKSMSPTLSKRQSLCQEDRDYLIALQMQHDEQGLYSRSPSNDYSDSDRALAASLQTQENELASYPQQHSYQNPQENLSQSQNRTEASRNNDTQQGKNKCCIL